MTSNEAESLLLKLKSLMETTPKAERIVAFRGFKLAHTPDEQRFLEIGFDLYLAGVDLTVEAKPLVVALIHGIRTTGVWQEKVRSRLLDQSGVTVVPIGFGYLDLFKFLGPFRKGAIERVEFELRDLRRQHPNANLVVVAHSFGTYVISKILKKCPDIRISRLLLCGSIIPTGFRWDQLPHEFSRETVVNDVGTKDYWPVLARIASWGYGGSGSFGFKTSRVWDRFFAYGHSDFFSDEHIQNFWFPFIVNGEVVNSPWDSQRPVSDWWLAFFGSVPFVKSIILVSLFGIAYGLQSGIRWLLP